MKTAFEIARPLPEMLAINALRLPTDAKIDTAEKKSAQDALENAAGVDVRQGEK